MKTLAFFAVLFSLTGCGGSRPTVIDPAIAPYVNDFLALSKQEGAPATDTALVVQFGDLTNGNDQVGDVVGYCDPGFLTPTITIDLGWWGNANPTQQRILVYHELGHCLLGQSHRSNSIMEPTRIDWGDYTDNETYYNHELFYPQ